MYINKLKYMSKSLERISATSSKIPKSKEAAGKQLLRAIKMLRDMAKKI